jgi:hypothetical protein
MEVRDGKERGCFFGVAVIGGRAGWSAVGRCHCGAFILANHDAGAALAVLECSAGTDWTR